MQRQSQWTRVLMALVLTGLVAVGSCAADGGNGSGGNGSGGNGSGGSSSGGSSGGVTCNDGGLLAYAFEVRQAYLNRIPFGSRWEITFETFSEIPPQNDVTSSYRTSSGGGAVFYRSSGVFAVPPPPPAPTCGFMEALWLTLGQDARAFVDTQYALAGELLIALQLRGSFGSWQDAYTLQSLGDCGHTDWGPCAPATFPIAEKARLALSDQGLRFVDGETLSSGQDNRSRYYREYYDGAGCGLTAEQTNPCDHPPYIPSWNGSVPISNGLIHHAQFLSGGWPTTERVTLRSLLLCEVPEYTCVYNEDCTDGKPCTRNLCVDGSCEFPPDDALDPHSEADCARCKDGAVEVCECKSDTDCDDGNPCTTNTCVGTVCVRVPNDNGTPPAENGVCRACSGGVRVACPCTSDGQCNDGNPCTHDFCMADRCRNRPDDGIIPPQDPGDCKRCVGGMVVSSVQEHHADCTVILQGALDVCTGMNLNNWRVDYSEVDETGQATQQTLCSGNRTGADCADEGVQQTEDECADACAAGGLPVVYVAFSDRACEAGMSNQFEGICSAICSGCR